jgi:hypothetical protein
MCKGFIRIGKMERKYYYSRQIPSRIQREYSSNFFPLGGIWEENPDYNSEQAPFSNRNKEKMYYRKWTRNITLANSMGTCQEICGNIR